MKIRPGDSYPLGPTWDGRGTNFALFSENAERVTLCLFASPQAGRERERIELTEVDDHVFHAYVPGVGPGQLYGYRVDGPYDPAWGGRRFNRHKLLVDPYARALAGWLNWRPPVFGYRLGDRDEDLALDRRNDAALVPKGVVIDGRFDWGDDRPPRTPWHNTLVYEVHVKGFTVRHPDVNPRIRGTYAGLHSPAALEHLKALGVTAVELLPVHAFVDERFLIERGLLNYWGYNSLNYFAPQGRYAAARDPGGQVREFKQMVKALHAAGIEVILDVVYNHTAEGDHRGPTLSYRGIDNTTYYRLEPERPHHYEDFTGTGNTVNARHPQTLKLITDSLRYWVEEMHVDGFRFDLAVALGRESPAFDRFAGFFKALHQDPVISRVKLIAEPWDVGEGGYQVGNFPVRWAEWNGKYRDTVRRYWKGDEGLLSELGFRLSGNSDLYQRDGRRPEASINFVTAHDGFTLADLVSSNEKHNEANGEKNQDGGNDNNSWNCGVEGPTDDPEILRLRARQRRNFMTTLLLSQGVPMICGGDEIGRTQHGNNNAYCQDNEVSWFDWNLGYEACDFLEWTRRLVRFRMEQPVLRRRSFFLGRPLHGSDIEDLAWFGIDGTRMTEQEWQTSFNRSVTVRLSGEALTDLDEHGERVVGDSLMLLLNGYHEPLPFVLPRSPRGTRWEVVFDTDLPRLQPGCRVLEEGGAPYRVQGRALVVLRRLG